MHLLDSIRHRFDCHPFIHEVGAAIGAEYFNQVSDTEKAFALVTAGPGLTNTITAITQAYIESRELLVIGGTAKSSDLSHGYVRQRGIQEADGVALAAPACNFAIRLDDIVDQSTFSDYVNEGLKGRHGPVFIEVCQDVQGRQINDTEQSELEKKSLLPLPELPKHTAEQLAEIQQLLLNSKRPLLLIGAGVSRESAAKALPGIERLGIPMMTSWHGADRISGEHPLYFGRPSKDAHRYANILNQQADLVIALGARLGILQTGYNWEEYAPLAHIVQVDIDSHEITKGHPRVDTGVVADANGLIEALSHLEGADYSEWLDFCRMVKKELPTYEATNKTGHEYLAPHYVTAEIAKLMQSDEVLIPCSAGGPSTIISQVFINKPGQKIVTDKSLESLGIGLCGAIGAAMAAPEKRVVLFEGDGGFAQNLQELGTAALTKVNVKIFVFDDNGYASIRLMQRNYFNGAYIGCDDVTGLGLPNWLQLFAAYGIPALHLHHGFERNEQFKALFNAPGPAAFVVPIDPEQTYHPKITSRVTESGSMVSNPLHFMFPPLPKNVEEKVLRYLQLTKV